jgi:hypothetical protein
MGLGETIATGARYASSDLNLACKSEIHAPQFPSSLIHTPQYNLRKHG